MDSKSQVENLLKNYHEIKRNLDSWEFEITRFPEAHYNDVIEGLLYAKPEGERVSGSGVSDKTAKTALAYRELANQQKDVVLPGLLKKYFSQKSEVEFLEFCIGKLDERVREIITDVYINRKKYNELCEKYYVSQTSLHKYRNKGIAQIAKMFDARNEFRKSEING